MSRSEAISIFIFKHIILRIYFYKKGDGPLLRYGPLLQILRYHISVTKIKTSVRKLDVSIPEHLIFQENVMDSNRHLNEKICFQFPQHLTKSWGRQKRKPLVTEPGLFNF